MTVTDSDRPAIIPSRDECEDLLHAIDQALGCIEIGRSDHVYKAAAKALLKLRDILNLDD